jgi:hypothetical protein
MAIKLTDLTISFGTDGKPCVAIASLYEPMTSEVTGQEVGQTHRKHIELTEAQCDAIIDVLEGPVGPHISGTVRVQAEQAKAKVLEAKAAREAPKPE